MKKVVVTGGSGRLGTWVVKEFVDHGYEVVNADIKSFQGERLCRTVIVDLKDLGGVYGVFERADAVVHLAAIPAPGNHPNEVVYQNNVMSSFNVLEAAAGLEIGKIVVASSESSYGICFAKHRLVPQYVPIDEEHPQLPQDCYGLSKIVNESAAQTFNRRAGMQVVSLRLGNVITPDRYKKDFATDDIKGGAFILWSYIDACDAASACRLAVEKDGLGAVALNIAADDNRMDVKSRDLMAAEYPEVADFREPLEGYESLLSNKKAKKVLGWQPVRSWRKYV